MPYEKIQAVVGDGGDWKWPRMWAAFDEIERRGEAYREGEAINFGPNKNPNCVAQKVLVVGGGGREHAIACKLRDSPKVGHVFCAPGNGGTAKGHDKISNVNIKETALDELAQFAKDNGVSLVACGPEAPLVIGVADKMKLNPLSKNLLLAVAENNRYSFLPAISTAFSTIMAAHRGEVVCEITTAKALDAGMAKEVEGALAGFLKKGEKALITYKVDAAIIGGMVVSIGDKFCDMSMATKLNKYSELLKAAA